MSLEIILGLVNLALTLAIAARLQIHKTGIFSIGFFSLGTGVFPHYVLMPLYGALTHNELASREYFTDGMLVVTAMLAGLLIGVWSTRSRVLPLYAHIREMVLPIGLHFALLGIAFLAVAGLMFFLAGTVNPFDVMSRTKSVEFRLKHEEFDLGYPILLILGTLLFSHGWLVVKLLSMNRSRTNLLLAIAATGVTMLAASSLGSRSALFSPLIILLFVIHHLYRRIPMLLVIGLFVLAIPVFVFSRLVGSGWDLTNLPRETSLGFVMDEFVQRFNLFDGLLDFLEWFKHKPFAYGASLLEVFIRPIPRQLMPNKPHSMDVFLTHQIYGAPYYGGGIQIFGALGEMFYNFGYVGVFLWFILLGRLTYRFHFGLFEVLKQRKTLVAAMLITNYGLLRGLTNCGINTIAFQQIFVTLFSQAFFCLLLFWLLRVYRSMAPNLRGPRRRATPPEEDKSLRHLPTLTAQNPVNRPV